MNLRLKLLLSYLIFVTALVVLGGWSAWRLREMGDVSRRIISNNYDSVVAAQEMKESLERHGFYCFVWLLREMGDVSRRIISNNYDSVVAAQEMKESLERQDSAALFALLGAREK